MGWLKKSFKKIKKVGKKVVGAHKVVGGALFGNKKLLGAGLKETGLVKGKKGKKRPVKEKRPRYTRKNRNPYISKSRRKFISTGIGKY